MNDFKIKMDNLFGNTQTRMRKVDQIFYQEMLDIRDRLDELEKEDIVKEDIEEYEEEAFKNPAITYDGTGDPPPKENFLTRIKKK